MKFGDIGGSPESLQLVKQIIENEKDPVIVVVSALNGITDRLLLAADFALNGNTGYKSLLGEIVARHEVIIEKMLASHPAKEALVTNVQQLFDELQNILRGVFLIGDLSQKTSDKIVSYGERLSSLILSRMIDDSKLYDPTTFIKTNKQFDHHIPDLQLSNELIRETFAKMPPPQWLSFPVLSHRAG